MSKDSKIMRDLLQEMQYKISSLEEIQEFLWLKSNITNINVDLFVDDGGSYIRNNHVLLLFARNGYNKSISEFIPFSISNDPIVLDNDIEYGITYDDIFLIQDFIQINFQILKLFADKKISHKEFINQIRPVAKFKLIMEDKKLLSEMATLRKEDSNLPMDVWLDEGATYQGHAPRLKFRASHEQRTTREFSSMLLTEPPTIENFPENSPLRKKDIIKLENFVKNNLELLLKLSNGEIDYITEFLPSIKF